MHMLRVATLTLVFLCLTAPFLLIVDFASSESEDSWLSIASLPAPLFSGSFSAVAVGGKIYAMGAKLDRNSSVSVYANYEYDPTLDKWWEKDAPNSLAISFTSVAYQNKIYVLGGYINSGTKLYNPANDSWENLFDTWGFGEPASVGVGTVANVVDDKIYVIGGKIILNPFREYANPVLDTTLVFYPSNATWNRLAPIPVATTGYASAVVDGKIYIIGGANHENDRLNLVQIFDPKTNTWSQGTPIPTAIRGAVAVATTGLFAPKRIYVFGGEYPAVEYHYSATNLTQVFDPQTDNWSVAASMPTARASLVAVNINDTLYAIGGQEDYTQLTTNEKYTPKGYTSPTPSPTPVTVKPSKTPSQSPFLPSASPSPSQQPTKSPEISVNPPPIVIYLFIAVISGLIITVTATAIWRTKRSYLCA